MLNTRLKQMLLMLLLVVNFYLFLLIFPKLNFVFNTLFSIVIPFLIAFVLTFLLNPIVNYLQKFFKKRWLAVFVVLLTLIIILFLFFRYVFILIVSELEIFTNRLPDIIREFENLINNFIKKVPIFENYNFKVYDNIMGYINKSTNIFQNTILTTKTLSTVINILKYVVVVPVILIYFLLDYDKIKEGIKCYLIKNHKNKIKDYLSELNKTMTSYFRGVFIVMFMLFMLFTIIFMILGIDNGLIFSIIIAITNVIPYIGSWIGTAIPVLYVLITSSSKAITLLIICVIIQTVEADMISPYVHGRRVKIHPLMLMLSLLFFGSLFGFIGMLIAVPMAAFINVTLKYYPLKIFRKEKETLLK